MSAIITADDLSELELSDLPSLARTIQWQFERSEKAFETALHHGIACGHALLAAKAKVPHGSWMSWVEGNTTISHSTVNMFMSLASNSQRVENLETIREALKLLAEDRREARRIVSETYVPYEGEESIVRVKVETPEPKESIVRVKVGTTDFTEPRPSPASSVIMDAEILEQEAQDIEDEDEEFEPLVVDGKTPEAPLSKKESTRLLELEAVIEKAQHPSDGEDPVEDAIGRLVCVLLSCSADYINRLADAVILTRYSDDYINRLADTANHTEAALSGAAQ